MEHDAANAGLREMSLHGEFGVAGSILELRIHNWNTRHRAELAGGRLREGIRQAGLLGFENHDSIPRPITRKPGAGFLDLL